MEYSLEYGFLRLSQATRQRLSIPVMVVTLGEAVGTPWPRMVQLQRPSTNTDPIHSQTPHGTSASGTALAACCWMSFWATMTSSCPV